MKNIFLFILLFICLKGFSQYPVKQTLGSDSTLVESKGALKGRIVNKPFSDTTQANTQRVKFYDGSQIWTTTDNKFWLRDSAANKWVEAGGGVVALSAIGSTPNANAATITGSVLNFEPADLSFGGIINTVAQSFSGHKSFDSLEIRATGEPSWVIRNRIVGLGFPVATIKPKLTGNIAFDIMPMGFPGNYLDNGIAWLDVTDVNVSPGSGDVTTARVGISGSAVQMGMRAFGGASEKKLNIVMGTDSIMTFNVDRTIDVNTADFSISKSTVGNNISWLLNPNTGNAASLFIIGQDFANSKVGFLRYENDGVVPSTYQNSNQFEIMALAGAINGMVVGTTNIITPLKFVTGSTERVRMRSDSVLWLTTPRQTDTTDHDILVRDRTTGNMRMIYAGLLGGGSTPTLQQVFATESNVALMTGNNTIDAAGNTFSIAGNGGNVTLSTGDASGSLLRLINTGKFVLQSTSGEGLNSNDAHAGTELYDADSIVLRSGTGRYDVANLKYLPGASTLMMVWDSLTNKWGTQPISGGSSLTAGYGILLPATEIILDTTIAVNKAGAQVISGAKNFTGVQTFNNNVGFNVTPVSNFHYKRNNTTAEVKVHYEFADGQMFDLGWPSYPSLLRITRDGSRIMMDSYQPLEIFAKDGSNDVRIGTNTTGGEIEIKPNSAVIATFSAGTGATSFKLAGSFGVPYVAKTALYTLTPSDYTVEVTSGTHTQTLPTAVGIAGRIYVITNSGAGTVTVGTTSSQTFVNVTATPTTLTLAQFATVTVQSNGANWLRLTSL